MKLACFPVSNLFGRVTLCMAIVVHWQTVQLCWGPDEHSELVLIYVCCDLLVNKY